MRFALRTAQLCCVVAGLLTVAAVELPVRGQEPGKKAGEHCFLWKVSSASGSVFLLGSMHLVPADFYPLPKEVENAFTQSKKLVVEVDTLNHDQTKVQGLILKFGAYPPGEALSKKLPAKTMDALRQYCAKKGIDVAQFESFRPWLVNTVIGVGEIQALGLSTEGVDTHFLKKAKAENKPIMELETAESQLQVLAGLTEELQGTMLAKLLAEVGKIREQFEKITAAWKAGDAKLMEEIMLQDPVKRVPEYEAVREKMFDERNEKMVEKLQAILKGGEPCMVIVGAGHLVGEKGIVKLLEKRKYRVEQVKRTAAKQTLKQHSQVLNALNALTM